MRKLILIATVSLLATQAYAGQSRSLSLAAARPAELVTEPPQTQAVQAPVTTTAPVSTTSAIATPVATTPATATPAPAASTTSAPTTTVATTPAKTVASKPIHRQSSTEARVIYELHRHGIYW